MLGVHALRVNLCRGFIGVVFSFIFLFGYWELSLVCAVDVQLLSFWDSRGRHNRCACVYAQNGFVLRSLCWEPFLVYAVEVRLLHFERGLKSSVILWPILEKFEPPGKFSLNNFCQRGSHDKFGRGQLRSVWDPPTTSNIPPPPRQFLGGENFPREVCVRVCMVSGWVGRKLGGGEDVNEGE